MHEYREREINYHEGAHAILHLHYFHTFAYCSVIPQDRKAGVLKICDCSQQEYEPVVKEKKRTTRIIDGKPYSYAKKFYVPLTSEQKEINLNHARISIAGSVAEEVLFGCSGDGWTGVFPGEQEIKGTDLHTIKRLLGYNFTTSDVHGRSVSSEIMDEAIAELRAETKLMFISTMGSPTTLLWAKVCKLADVLLVKRKLSFSECWKLFAEV